MPVLRSSRQGKERDSMMMGSKDGASRAKKRQGRHQHGSEAPHEPLRSRKMSMETFERRASDSTNKAHASNTLVPAQKAENAIAVLARACRAAFQSIGVASEQNATIMRRIPMLFKQQKRAKAAFTLSDLEDEFEQFRVWADNLGVFAKDHSSLDFRLREATDVKAGIISLLESLRLNLVEGLFLLERDREFDSDNDSEATSSDSQESLSILSKPESNLDLTAVELQGRLQQIVDLVNKLIKLAAIIRSSGIRNRNLRAANYIHEEDGINQTEVFENDFLPQVLKLRFRLEEPLLSRICKAISLRRRRFMYQIKHQKRLAYGFTALETLPQDRKARPVTGVIEKTALSTDLSRQASVPSLNTNLQAGSTLQPQTKATTFDQMPLKRKLASSMVSGTTRSFVADDIDIPPPPPLAMRATHFECPYCCLLIEETKRTKTTMRTGEGVRDPKRWRKHVIADLQPFVCVEPDCSTPDLIFDTQEDWAEHQRWEHAMEWWCDGDEKTHSPTPFTSQEEFLKHIKNVHNPPSTNSLSRLITSAGRPSLQPFRCCPFCDFLPEGMKTTGAIAPEDGVISATSFQKELQSHIARELLLQFLLALPERKDIKDVDSDTESLRVARSSATDLADISLDFSNLSSDPLPLITGIEDDSLRNPVPGINEDFWDEIWAALDSAHSVRKAYAGPETDQILKNFVDAQASHQEPAHMVVPSITVSFLDHTVLVLAAGHTIPIPFSPAESGYLFEAANPSDFVPHGQYDRLTFGPPSHLPDDPTPDAFEPRVERRETAEYTSEVQEPGDSPISFPSHTLNSLPKASWEEFFDPFREIAEVLDNDVAYPTQQSFIEPTSPP